MTTDRIERAARALCNEGATVNGVWRCQRDTEACRDCRDEAKAVLTAAFPELFADPPSHWPAPRVPTDDMLLAGRDALRVPDPDGVFVADHVRQIYYAMRDAHLKEQA